MEFVLKRIDTLLKKRISSVTAAHTTLRLEDTKKAVIKGVGERERDSEVTRNMWGYVNPIASYPLLSLFGILRTMGKQMS